MACDVALKVFHASHGRSRPLQSKLQSAATAVKGTKLQITSHCGIKIILKRLTAPWSFKANSKRGVVCWKIASFRLQHLSWTKALWKYFHHSEHFIALDISKSDFQCLIACGQITAIIYLQIGSWIQPHYLGVWRHCVQWFFSFCWRAFCFWYLSQPKWRE